jgi:hypothetical protein
VPAFITMLGSSTTDNDSDFNTTSNTYKFNGEGPLSWVNRIAKQRFGRIRDMRSSLQYHFGFAGLTTRQLIDAGHAAACAAATAACGGVAYIQGLQNDIGTEVAAATCLARLEEVCDIFDAAGANYIICEPFRRLSTETNAAAKLVIYEAVIAGIPAIASAHGVGVAEWSTLGEDGSTGYVRADYVNSGGDPGHPLPPLAYLMGKECWRVHQLMFAVPDPPDLSALLAHASNINPYGGFDNGGAGTNPVGVTVANVGSGTSHVKGARVAYGDGSGAYKFPVTPTVTASGGSSYISLASNLAAGWAEGDIMEAVCEIDCSEGTGWAFGFLACGMNYFSSFWEPIDGIFSYTTAAPPAAIERPTDTIVLRSMARPIPASQTAINSRIYLGGSGTAKVGKWSILKNHGDALLPPNFEYP